MPGTLEATISPERRVSMSGISWALYQQLLHQVGDGHVRLTYDQGSLEIMSPSPLHEKVKTILGRLIEAYGDAEGIDVEGLGSTTFGREDLLRALEPDECYYIAHAANLIGKTDIDLSIDPPPDLAIEIDISPPDVARQPIYGALGVPEIWRYDGRGLMFLRREDDDRYVRIESSKSFPKVTAAWMNELLTLGLKAGQSAAVAELRRRCGA